MGCGQSSDKVESNPGKQLTRGEPQPEKAVQEPPRKSVQYPEEEEMFHKKKQASPAAEKPSAENKPSADTKVAQGKLPTGMEESSTPVLARQPESEIGEGEHNMAEVALALTSETDVRKLAGIILGKCRQLSRGDRSALFLLDETTRELVEFAYDAGQEVELREHGIRVQIGSGVAGHCGATGNVEVVEDAYEDTRWAGQEFDRRSGYRTRQLLCCPIKGPTQKVLGVMQIVNTVHGGQFAKKDIAACQAMSASAGVALENAANLAKAQEKEKQLNALLGAMDALLFTFDTEGVLVSCNKTSEGSIRWKGFMGKHFAEWLGERNGDLSADMQAAFEKKKTVFVPQYAFKSGLTHTFINYKAIPINDVNAVFQGVLLLIEPCSNHAQLVQSLSRHMESAMVAAACGINDEKLKGKPATLTLLMLSITGPSLASTVQAEMRLVAINEVVAQAANLVQKDGGMLLQMWGHTIIAAFGYNLVAGGEKKEGAAGAAEPEAHAAAACKCAQRVAEKIDKMVEAKKKKIAGGADKKKAVELAVAVGVHTGVTCVGTVGYEKLVNLAVLGDTATLAWCVHGAAVASQAQIVISADTHALLQKAGEQKELAYRPLARARIPAQWVPSSGPSADVAAAVEAAPLADEVDLVAVQLLSAKAATAADAALKAYAEGLEQAQAGAWEAAVGALKPHAEADGPCRALLAQCEAAAQGKLDLAAAAAGRRLTLPPPFF